jgi:xanthine dehydrogenase accessory factor
MRHGPCALVEVVSTQGSVPRDKDAWMIVAPDGFHGSIGGGTLEWNAMAEAKSMLTSHGSKRELDYVLGPDLGQCCGGRVRVSIEVFDHEALDVIKAKALRSPEERRAFYLFGAGHVGRALVLALAPLPFAVTWADTRTNAFPTVMPQDVVVQRLDDPVSIFQDIRPASFVFVMTHSHEIDFAIVDAALRQSSVAHVGLIGSATKRARFEKRLRGAGVDPDRVEKLICPIGVAGITSKHPAAIAAAVAAQVLQLHSALGTAQ